MPSEALQEQDNELAQAKKRKQQVAPFTGAATALLNPSGNMY